MTGTSTDKTGIELIGLGRAILNKQLAVPIYQRSYAWEDKHVLDLFSDISNAIEQEEPEYFLGSIVTTKNDSPRPEVVDGQQRLATTAILLAAIRDYFSQSNDPMRADHIASTYLFTRDLKTLEAIPKLHLNLADNEFFAKRILEEPASPNKAIDPTKESHKRIARAADLARTFVKQFSAQPKPTDQLARWVEYITDSVKVIWVAVYDDANAFRIFETLNDRGLALAISDLLKNYLFGLAGSRIAEVQHRWQSMTGTLEAVDNEDAIVTYMRHLWSSRHGLTREKDLYSDIKKKVHTKQDAVALSTELAEKALLYAAILNPNHDFWDKYSPTARQHMETLNLLQMTQIRPLVLSVLEQFSVKEVQAALRLMVFWAVRFLITGGLGSGSLESQYSQRAQEVKESKTKTAKQLSAKLNDIVPNDSQFRQAFSAASVSKNYLARYYLRVLEKQATGEPDPELSLGENTEVVNLEHVLPLNPSNAWNHIPEDDRATHVKRIGNLALLKTRINSEAGNDSLALKKPFYKKSKYTLTSSLADYAVWDTAAILKRQSELADLAVAAWPLK